MANEQIVVLVLSLWILIAPLGLLLVALYHERRLERRRYRPPPPAPGDDWGGTHVYRPGWWDERTR